MRGRRLWTRGVVVGGLTALFAVVVTLAGPSAPAGAVTLPADNLLSNPSFETSLAPWVPASSILTRVMPGGSLTAPDGSYVGRLATQVLNGVNRVVLDNAPGETTISAAGVTYSGAASVAAANPATVGDSAYLVVRESTPSGAFVASWSSPAATLGATTFQRLTVSGTTHAAGDYIDVYVYENAPGANDAMYVDAVSLESAYPLPTTNLLANPSFDPNVSGWDAYNATLTRTTTPNAPDRAGVARMQFTGTPGLVMSMSAGTGVTTSEDRTYTASAVVRAGVAGTVGRNAVIRIREREADGTVVKQASSPATPLTDAWLALTVTLKVDQSGDTVDMVIVEQAAAAGDVVQADAVSLAADASGLGELAIDYNQDDLTELGNTAQYEYVVLQSQHHDDDSLIGTIQTKNHTTKVYGLVNTTATNITDCPGGESDVDNGYGLSYCWVNANHGGAPGQDDWFLHSGTPHTVANRIAFARPFTNARMMNVGLPAYQNAWAAMVKNYMTAAGFDGVYLDDVNTYPGHGADGMVDDYQSATDPNGDQTYGLMMTQFVANVGDQLHAAGLSSLGNVALTIDSTTTPWEIPDALAMAAHLDGTNREFLSHSGSNDEGCAGTGYSAPFTNPVLSLLQNYTVAVNGVTAFGHPAAFTGIDYNLRGDTARMSYGRADFLLTWTGQPDSGAYFNRPCGDVIPGNRAWTTQLGLPVDDPKPNLVNGVYLRHYTDGVVLLNPAAAGNSINVALDGSYTDQNGHAYHDQVLVPPATGLLLTRTSYS